MAQNEHNIKAALYLLENLHFLIVSLRNQIGNACPQITYFKFNFLSYFSGKRF